MDQIVAVLLNADSQGYFALRRRRPSNQAVRWAQRTKRKHVQKQVKQGARDEVNHNPFPPFNPQSDINCGQFVALSVDRAEVEGGVPFYVGKVIEDGKNQRSHKIKVCWYWPIIRGENVDRTGSTAQRYANCIDAFWEPSCQTHIEKEACIFCA